MLKKSRLFTPGPTPVPLTPTGRQMALRYLISKHRGDLLEFGKVAERGGFLESIATSIAELFQETVSMDDLDRAAATAQTEERDDKERKEGDAERFPRNSHHWLLRKENRLTQADQVSR